VGSPSATCHLLPSSPRGETLAGGAPSTVLAGSIVCAECGNAFPQDEVIRFGDAWVCAACKPIFVQKLKEGATVAGVMEYAGFWIRFGASLLDGIILGVVNAIIRFVPLLALGIGAQKTGARLGRFSAAVLLLALIQYGVAITYEKFFVGKFGATPGKMACRLRVVTADGGRVGYGRAFGRYFAKLLSAITLCIGYLMVAFDKEEHRGLHDRICNTRVIKR
jgi:uncharacterized RDD family membrane protein YckC